MTTPIVTFIIPRFFQTCLNVYCNLQTGNLFEAGESIDEAVQDNPEVTDRINDVQRDCNSR